MMEVQWLRILFSFGLIVGSLEGNCRRQKSDEIQFHLVRQCQRASTDKMLALENTATFYECVQLAHRLRGLALNYAPGGKARRVNRFHVLNDTAERRFKHERSQLSVFEQPAEFFNCHVLQCPQDAGFQGMLNDSRFDYYSIYGRPTVLTNYTCVPEVGLFLLYTERSSYANASKACSNASEYSGSLAHVASDRRTTFLAQLLVDYNKQHRADVFLAFVGLQYNRTLTEDFYNAQYESLECFLYRAWDVRHPRRTDLLSNNSCVALTTHARWQTLNCDHPLPYICEIFIAPHSRDDVYYEKQLDIGPNSVNDCHNYY